MPLPQPISTSTGLALPKISAQVGGGKVGEGKAHEKGKGYVKMRPFLFEVPCCSPSFGAGIL